MSVLKELELELKLTLLDFAYAWDNLPEEEKGHLYSLVKNWIDRMTKLKSLDGWIV